MINSPFDKELKQILLDIVEEIDVPPSKYEEAKNRYDSVGDWLNKESSYLHRYNPKIYPQGSFALGTVIRPFGKDEYDVDLVCKLEISTRDITQKQLKDIVGRRLKENEIYNGMLDPRDGGRRCWTLKYADSSKFHLDILPAIPDDTQKVINDTTKHAICITDKEQWHNLIDWPKSNPQGYVEWFKRQMRLSLEEGRKRVARRIRADVQDIPDYKVHTPLQQVIKILKYHRDRKYNGDDDKPISIIISTLAAKAYSNQPDLLDAFNIIVPAMRKFIEKRDGDWWIENPVNENENFADKWNETPRKQELFFEWIKSIEEDHYELNMDNEFEKVEQILNESYGHRIGSKVIAKHASRFGDKSRTAKRHEDNKFEVPHKQQPQWPIKIENRVAIKAYVTGDGRTFRIANNSTPLPKFFGIKFQAETNVQEPFEVYWQVVNTGEEAKEELRGEFYNGEGKNDLERNEPTGYKGMHWVECFIVKNSKCVARSGEFVINVK